MTNIIHSDARYANVWAIEVVNEPVPPNDAGLESMLSQYFGVPGSQKLHIQMMDAGWFANKGRGPSQYLTEVITGFALYDDHKYLVWDTSVPATRQEYMYHSCYGDVGGNSPVIVGE